MHVFEHSPETRSLFLYFFGELIGPEFDDAILEAARALPLRHLKAVVTVVADLRDITAADLTHTDGGRVFWFESQLRQTLQMTHTDFESFMLGLKIARLIHQQSSASATFRKRLKLTNAPAIVDREQVFTSVQAVAEAVGQDAAYIDDRLRHLAHKARL